MNTPKSRYACGHKRAETARLKERINDLYVMLLEERDKVLELQKQLECKNSTKMKPLPAAVVAGPCHNISTGAAS